MTERSNYSNQSGDGSQDQKTTPHAQEEGGADGERPRCHGGESGTAALAYGLDGRPFGCCLS